MMMWPKQTGWRGSWRKEHWRGVVTVTVTLSPQNDVINYRVGTHVAGTIGEEKLVLQKDVNIYSLKILS